MTKQEVLPLRIALGLLALFALLAQLVVVPWAASSGARAYPEVAYLASPYVTVIVIALIGFELALLAAWQLVSAAVAGRTLTRRSTRWADIMTASLVFMAVIFAGVFAYTGSVENVGGPPMLFGLLASLALVPIAFALRCWLVVWLENDDACALVSR